jgi:hypothetical protein
MLKDIAPTSREMRKEFIAVVQAASFEPKGSGDIAHFE